MFFIASKILVWFVYPLSVAVLLLILAYGALLLKKRALFHILFLLALLILYLSSIEPVADFLLKPLERQHFAPRSELKADAIVVLAGDLRKTVYPRSDIEVRGSRVLKAIRLYRAKAAPTIIMAGGSGDLFGPGFKEALSMKDLAAELGVPEKTIIPEARSRNTRESAVYTKEILSRMKAKKIILVTSAVHLRRSLAVFKKLGIDAVPVASDFLATERKYDPFSFIPESETLWRTSVAVKEYAGIFAYWLMGWI